MVACATLYTASARADGVCAQVHLQLQQQMVLTRTAFHAALELSNGTDGDILEGIAVTLEIRDLSGQPANALFNASQVEVTGIVGGIDGGGSLGPASEGTVAWTVIPYHDAAPTAPTQYDFGGEFAYTLNGELVVVPLFPERMTVYPDPILQVRYFWQRDVYGDDPFTPDVVEPSEPFSLGLMIHNSGAGIARNLHITSAQPKIYEGVDGSGNPRGLLINFQLVGTQVGTQAISPSLAVNFGDLGAGQTGIARFLMTSSLQGHFLQYSASYEHVTGLGDPRLSLIDELKIYELVHVVQATYPYDDQLPDFLVNLHTWYPLPPLPWEDPPDPREDPNDPERRTLPDTLYLSDGTTVFVTPVLDGIIVTKDEPNYGAQVLAPMPGGWAYLKFPDPYEGQYALIRVERSDGSELLLDWNAWQTDRTFINDQIPLRLHRIHLFDRSADAQYVQYALFFTPDTTPPTAVWRSFNTHGQGLGVELPLEVSLDGLSAEPRAGGIHKLSAFFSEPIRAETLGTVNVLGLDVNSNEVPVDPSSISTALDGARTRADIIFNPPLTDYARYCIRLIGVTDAVGNPLAVGSQIVVTALKGDATGDRRVNNTDVGAIASLVGTDPIDPGNPRHIRSDLSGDGKIDGADLDIAFQARGHDARTIPAPCPVAMPLSGAATQSGQAGESPARSMARTGSDERRSAIPEPTLVGPGESP